MVKITQKRFPGQDGKPTNNKLVKLLNQGTPLIEIPHSYFFPDIVLKNLITMKRAVLRNKEAYLRIGGGNKMTSAVIVIDGKSNSGKSTLASQIGLFFDPTMTLEKNYCWNMDRLFQIAKNTYPGMVIIMDEAMVVNSRSANSDENKKLIIALSQIRSKGVFFIFCINSVHQLEKSIPLSRANFLLHVKRIGGISGIPKYCAYDEDKMRDLIIKNAGKYSYRGVFPNTDWATFSKYFPFDDVRYDKLKHKESVKNINAKQKEGEKEVKARIALMKLVEYCKRNGLITKYTEMSKITGLAANTLSDYKRRYESELVGQKTIS